jgi:hypothetical protein
MRIKLFESPLPTSRTVIIAAGAKTFASQWHEEWLMSLRYTHISTFDDATLSKVLEKMYDKLSRLQCSVLTQLRTGHIGLNTYLHRFKIVPSPLCPHCATLESVPHLLLICPAYHHVCLRLIIRVKTACLSLRTLLSAKSDAAPVLAFVRETGRLLLKKRESPGVWFELGTKAVWIA